MRRNEKIAQTRVPTADVTRKGTSFIYVLGATDGTELKIGFAKDHKNLLSRKKNHEERGPDIKPMEWLAIVHGSSGDETIIHNRFRQYVINNKREWYNPCHEDIRAWIRYLRTREFVAHSYDEIDQMFIADTDSWLPINDANFMSVPPQPSPPPPPQPTLFPELFPESISAEKDPHPPKPHDPWEDLRPILLLEGDYYTPREIIEPARQTFGGVIDLDPASSRSANSIVKASRFYNRIQNGLSLSWFGKVWLNPPFGHWDDWAPKVIRELENIKAICLLAGTGVISNRNFQPIMARADIVCVLAGRHAFYGPLASAPTEGNVIFYIGPDKEAFRKSFGALGTVWEK